MVEKGRKDAVISAKILKEIADIYRYTADMSERGFYADDKTQKAVSMTLINIGELSKYYSAEFIAVQKNIPWRDIQATRNIAAHNYESFDMRVVWKTIREDLVVLKKMLEQKEVDA